MRGLWRSSTAHLREIHLDEFDEEIDETEQEQVEEPVEVGKIQQLYNWVAPIGQWFSDPEHKRWIAFQDGQSEQFFEQSEIYTRYTTSLGRNLMSQEIDPGLNYCFGQFARFLTVPPETSTHGFSVWTLIADLLAIYDTCKGYRRYWLGDLEHISFIRSCLKHRDLQDLSSYNWLPYAYDYTKIHAHTVAVYSLSTLCMRLISHRLAAITKREDIPYISADICNIVREQKCFAPKKGVRTVTQIISQIIPGAETNISLLEAKNCPACSRIVTQLYSKHNVCLDCSLRRICYVCGVKAVHVLRKPVCEEHNT
jgi:hypothetical protein